MKNDLFPFTDKYLGIKEHIDEIIVLASLLDLHVGSIDSVSNSIGKRKWGCSIYGKDKNYYIDFYYNSLDCIVDSCIYSLDKGKTDGLREKYIVYGVIDSEFGLQCLYSGLQRVKEEL